MTNAQQRLDAFLKSPGNSKRKLAMDLGISRAYITMMLRGQRRLRIDIASALGKRSGMSIEDIYEAVGR